MSNGLVTLNDREVNDLAEDALNAACLVIQEKLGVETGDLAGLFFSGGEVKEHFINYINSEINNKE